MQFTKKYKHILSIILILSISVTSYTQETDSLQNNNITDIEDVNTVNRKGKLSGLFKKKDKVKDNDQTTDSIVPKGKKGFFSFLRRKNKSTDNNTQDSTYVSSDSLDNTKKNGLFNRNTKKSDSAGGSAAKPQKIIAGTWRNMNISQQDSLLLVWDDYDSEHYKKKKRYSFSRKEVEIALSGERNFYEKMIYNRSRNKPFKYSKKLINRKNSRYRKAMKLEKLNKDIPVPEDTITDKNRYQLINKQYRIQAKREAIRKNKVIIKYDKMEDRLRRKYELSGDEKKVLNKGRGMKLKGAELITYNRARKKQEAFTEKLTKMRRDRSIALQNKKVQTKMKKKNRLLKNKDKNSFFGDLFKMKKKDNKHDSDEYPKQYHK